MIRLIFFFNKLIYCLSFKRIYFNWFKNLFAQFSLLCINLTLNEPCFSPRILNIAVLLKKKNDLFVFDTNRTYKFHIFFQIDYHRPKT